MATIRNSRILPTAIKATNLIAVFYFGWGAELEHSSAPQPEEENP